MVLDRYSHRIRAADWKIESGEFVNRKLLMITTAIA